MREIFDQTQSRSQSPCRNLIVFRHSPNAVKDLNHSRERIRYQTTLLNESKQCILKRSWGAHSWIGGSLSLYTLFFRHQQWFSGPDRNILIFYAHLRLGYSYDYMFLDYPEKFFRLTLYTKGRTIQKLRMMLTITRLKNFLTFMLCSPTARSVLEKTRVTALS